MIYATVFVIVFIGAISSYLLLRFIHFLVEKVLHASNPEFNIVLTISIVFALAACVSVAISEDNKQVENKSEICLQNKE